MCSSAKGCLKFAIIFFNIPVLLIGAAALGTGIWVLVDEGSFFDTYTDVLDISTLEKQFIRDAAIVLTTGGSATLLFAILGIVGAVTTNTCLLGLYAIVLTLLIAVEVAAVILGIVFKNQWGKKLDDDIVRSIQSEFDGKTDSTNSFTAAMNELHKNKQCCGWVNASDFDTTGSQWNRTLQDGRMAKIPPTCCHAGNETFVQICVKSPTANNSYRHEGCKQAVEDLFIIYQGVVIGFGVSIVGFEFFMLVLAILLITNTVSNKYNMS